jgi:hypothetical protein
MRCCLAKGKNCFKLLYFLASVLAIAFQLVDALAHRRAPGTYHGLSRSIVNLLGAGTSLE